MSAQKPSSKKPGLEMARQHTVCREVLAQMQMLVNKVPFLAFTSAGPRRSMPLLAQQQACD